MGDLWVAEYSIKQGSYHVDPLSVVLRHNLDNIEHDADPGYVPIGVFQTDDEAYAFVAAHRKARETKAA